MKTWWQFLVFFFVVSALLSPAFGQDYSNDAFTGSIPFKFRVGDQTLKPGTYCFSFSGVGLVAVRDHRGRVVARLMVRPIQNEAAPTSSKLVFHRNRKSLQLAQIQIGNRSLTLEILGTDLAFPQSMPAHRSLPSLSPEEIFGALERPRGTHLHE